MWPSATSSARLSSAAAAGEILVSQAAYTPGLGLEDAPTRRLALKGKSEEVTVSVLRVANGQPDQPERL